MRNSLKQSSHRRSSLVSAFASLAGLHAAVVAAQSVSTGTPLEEIVVTAQKRTERLQDVPSSVAVVSGEKLRNEGAADYTDYLNTVPGVSYAKNGGYKDKIFIRGLSDSLSSRVLSTTGIYIDETPITEVDASLGDIGTFDVDRVEVLRGPQGTLFGSGSMGGTVRIITNKPKLDDYEGLLDGNLATMTAGGGSYEENGMVNIPVVKDVLAVRAVAGYRHDGGFIDNIATGEHNINGSSATTARVLVDAKPVDKLDVLLSFQYQGTDERSGPNQDVGLGRYEVRRLYPEDNRFTARIYGATVNYTLPFATLTSATSYIDKNNFSVRDLTNAYSAGYKAATGSSVQNLGIGLNYKFPNKALVQELRAASTSAGPFHWLGGVYYNYFDPTNQQYVTSTDPTVSGFNYVSSFTQPRRREIAGFAEVTLDATARLALTAGVRHSSFDIKSSGYASGTLNNGFSLNTPIGIKQNATVGKYRADYKIAPDNLVYAQAAQGFRPGGTQSGATANCAAELQTYGFATPPTQYNPDSLWNYEIGSKNQFLERRLTLNADSYYIKWSNSQVAQNLKCGAQIISNAGGATVKGVEFDAQVAPLEGLTLALGGAYTDAEFTGTNSEIRTVKGGRLPNAPEWTVSISGDYARKLANGLDGYLHSDLQHVGSRFNDLPLSPTKVNEPGYTIVNLRVGVIHGPWNGALFVKNLGNELAILNTYNASGLDYQTVNYPRTVGVEVRRSF